MNSRIRTICSIGMCAAIGLLMFSGAAVSASPEQGSTWTVETGIRQEGGWAGASTLVQLPDGRLRTYNGDASPLTGFYPTVINSWISADGINWTKENAMLIGDGLSYWANGPGALVLHDGRTRIYFDNALFPFGTPEWQNIVSAISDDGLTWTIEDGVRVPYGGVYDSLMAGGANIVKLRNGKFRMYYHGYDGQHYRILSALSEDGLVWTKEEGVRIDLGGTYDAEGAYAPHVIRVADGRYIMFYAGSTGMLSSTIQSATSYDGLTWEKESGTRMTASDLPGGPYSNIGPAALVKLSDDEYRMYITADRYPNVFFGDRIVVLSAVGRIPAANNRDCRKSKEDHHRDHDRCRGEHRDGHGDDHDHDR